MDPIHVHETSFSLPTEALAALAALAEPNRARIFELLRHGEHCGCDVGHVLGLSTALVSHHLRALRASGLVRERRAGRWVYYSLDLQQVAAVRASLFDLLTPGAGADVTCGCTDCARRGFRDVGPVLDTQPVEVPV